LRVRATRSSCSPPSAPSAAERLLLFEAEDGFFFYCNEMMTCITGVWDLFFWHWKFFLAKHAYVTGVTPEFISEHRSCI